MCHYHVKAVLWKLVFLVNNGTGNYLTYHGCFWVAQGFVSPFGNCWNKRETGEPPPCLFSPSAPWSPWHRSTGQDLTLQYLPVHIRNLFCVGLCRVCSCSGVKPHLSTNVQFFRWGEAAPTVWSEAPSTPGLSASDLTTFVKEAPRSSLLTPSLLHFPCC